MKITNQSEVSSFLSAVSARIQFKEARPEIELELSRHLEEMVEEGIRSGQTQEEATKNALKRMGNPEEIGDRLDVVHTPQIPWLLLAMAGGMLALGVFNVLEFNRLGSHSVNILIGALAAALLFWIKPSQLVKASGWIFAGGLMFLGAAAIWGEKYQGLPFLKFLCFNINAVDFTIAPLMISLSAVIGNHGGKTPPRDYALVAISVLPVLAFAVLGSPYGSLLFAAAALAMMVAAATTRGAVLVVAFCSAIFVGFSLSPQHFLSAEAFQAARIAEAHTDFVLTHLQERSSLLGTVGIFLALAMIAQLGIVLREVRSPLGKTAIAGHLTMLALAIAWSVLANLGYVAMPGAGAPLPLVSYGGSILVGQLALLGLSVGYYRRRTLTLARPSIYNS